MFWEGCKLATRDSVCLVVQFRKLFEFVRESGNNSADLGPWQRNACGVYLEKVGHNSFISTVGGPPNHFIGGGWFGRAASLQRVSVFAWWRKLLTCAKIWEQHGRKRLKNLWVVPWTGGPQIVTGGGPPGHFIGWGWSGKWLGERNACVLRHGMVGGCHGLACPSGGPPGHFIGLGWFWRA